MRRVPRCRRRTCDRSRAPLLRRARACALRRDARGARAARSRAVRGAGIAAIARATSSACAGVCGRTASIAAGRTRCRGDRAARPRRIHGRLVAAARPVSGHQRRDARTACWRSPRSARDLAREVDARLAAKGARRDAWDHATRGRGRAAAGRAQRARRHYAEAHALAGADAGAIATMRRQLLLLSRVLPDAARDARRGACGRCRRLHRPHDRCAGPRRPAVSRAPRAGGRGARCAPGSRSCNRPVFYGSAACGADIIVLEAALAAGAEVNVVLPFDRQDFIRSSVVNGGERWLARFDAALSARRADRAGDRGAPSWRRRPFRARGAAGRRARGAARRAAAGRPRLLCVIDAASGGQVGGTRSAFERWQRCIGAPDVIDLAALRAKSPIGSPRMHASRADATPQCGRQRARMTARRARRGC